MAIAYRNGTTAGNSSGADVTITKPTGTVDGDILIAVCYNEIGATAWTPPAGWAQWGSGQANNAANAWINVYWKRASGEAADYTFSIASTWRVIAMGAFSGCLETGDPIDVGPTGNNSGGSSGYTVIKSITSTVTNTMRVGLRGDYNGVAGDVGSSGFTAGAALGGCEIYYAAQATAEASGDKTLSGASNSTWMSYHLALKPASGAVSVALNAATLTASAQVLQGQDITVSLAAATITAAAQAVTPSSPAFTFFGAASTPADNSTNTASPTAVTPPGSMVAGQLVWMQGTARAASGTLSISQAGGQTWTSLTQNNNTTCRRRQFWCIFNGTWSANPSVTMGSTTCNEVVMLVFTPVSSQNTTVADVAEVDATVTAPANPYTITITGQTIAENAVAIAAWNVIAARTFGTLSGAGWSKASLGAQYRCTSGSGETASFAYFIGQGATGNVSQNESGSTAGATSILSFKAITPTTVSLNAATLTASPQALTVDAPAGGLSVSLASATLAAAAQALAVVPGAVTPSLSAATLTAAPQTATASAITGLAVNLNSASLTASAGAVTTYTLTSNHEIYIGNGYFDGTPQQTAWTSDARLWAATWKFDNYPQGPVSGLGQTLRMYRADQVGTPSTFTRMDSAHEPVDVTDWSICTGASDVLHVLWMVRSSWSGGGTDNYLKYCEFDTVNGLWGSITNIETALNVPEQGQGDELLSMAVDSNGDPHIVYLKNDGTRRRVAYRNKIGGSWSAATYIDDNSYGAGQYAHHPGIVFDQNGNRVVSWVCGSMEASTDGRPYVRVYTGGAWGTTHDIAGANMWPGIDTTLHIRINSANRYTVSYLNTSKQIQYRYSTDLGATWSPNSPGGGTALGDDPIVVGWVGDMERIFAHNDPATDTKITYWEGHGGASPWSARTVYNTSSGMDCSVSVSQPRYFGYSQAIAVAYWKSNYPTNEAYFGVDNSTVSVTVNLNAASLTASPQTLTVVPGARSVSLAAATLTAAGQYIAPAVGAVTQALNAASLTASPQTVTPAPGAYSVALNAASLAASPQAVAPAAGVTYVDLNAATLTADPQVIQAGPGPVWVRAYSAELTASAQTITEAPGAATVSLSVTTLTAGAQTITPYIQASGVVVTLQAAAMGASAQGVTVLPGAVSISLSAAALAATVGKLQNTAKPDKLVLTAAQDWGLTLGESQEWALTLAASQEWALTLTETGGRNE